MSPYRLVIFLYQPPLRSRGSFKQYLFISLRYKKEFILKITPRDSLKGKKRKNWKMNNPFRFIDIGFKNITNEIDCYQYDKYNKLTDDDLFIKGGNNIVLYDLQYTSPIKFRKAISKIWKSIIHSKIEDSPRLDSLYALINELDILTVKDIKGS